MNRRRILFFLWISVCCLFRFTGSAQTIESLNREIARAEEQIRTAEALQGKVRKNMDVSRSQLKLIATKINNRNRIISSLDKQIGLLDKDISTKRRSIESLGQKLAALKSDYADMVYSAYKNYKLNNSLVFLFSSQDFADMTRRLDYMRRWNGLREREARKIDSLSHDLTVEVDSLGLRIGELAAKKQTRSDELTALAAEKREYNESLKKLSRQEQKISGQIKEQERAKKRAEEKLQKLIAEEAKRAESLRRSAAEEKRYAELTGRFDQNKGRLPLPIKGGIIIDHYGRHQHPTQKNLIIDNKGVNIAAAKGAAVACVFDGVVSSIVFIKGLNNCVMVRHGSYLTVYSNLANVSVSSGDKVGAYQTLGHLPSGTDDDCFLHFELWENTTNLNPELWFRQ